MNQFIKEIQEQPEMLAPSIIESLMREEWNNVK